MRAPLVSFVCAAGLFAACGKGENAGAEEAAKAAEAELKAKVSRGESAKKISPPVPGNKRVPCEQLLGDLAAWTTALGETEQVTIKDTAKSDAEAAASCALVRGGKRPTESEQQALLKKSGRLGVMAGDEICNVAAYCWTIENPDRFRSKCKDRKDSDDESMGTYACRQLVMQGADDVFVYRFFDADTKCIIGVRGGPSNVDNDKILKCAIAARDTITPAAIAVDGAAPAPAAAPAEPAGSGS